MTDKKLSISEIENIRREYRNEELLVSEAEPDPFMQFDRWFRQALNSGLVDPNAMTLATAASNGYPSARIVLLKGYDSDGFVFYTNYESRKGNELLENPRSALVFYWDVLSRQVRVEGRAKKLPAEDSEKYFRTRPYDSQISAWASDQSAEITDRASLEKKVEALKQKFGKRVPLPPFWGGYRVIADRMEFWQGRPGRLHDRIEYRRDGSEWIKRRLAP